MPKGTTVFVTGATGNQGGAVTRHLLRNGFHVKALVRNPDSPRAVDLRRENVQIVKGDLNDPATYQQHLSSDDLVFCNLHFAEGVEKEISQGLLLTDLAKERGVRHFVYSSVVGCDMHTGIPHWESKFKIEKHIQSSGMDYTILRPASLYENLLLSQVKSRILKGKLVLPTKADKVQEFIGADDIGLISTAIFANTTHYTGKIIPLAAEKMDGNQLAALFAQVLNRKMKFSTLPGFITRLALGKDLFKMFRWVNNNDVLFVKDIEALKNEFPGMTPLSKWIENHFVKSPARY